MNKHWNSIVHKQTHINSFEAGHWDLNHANLKYSKNEIETSGQVSKPMAEALGCGLGKNHESLITHDIKT